MKLDYSILNKLTEVYGDAYYLLDSKQFEENFIELKNAFVKQYPKFNIAYSYKTNYIPKLCKIVDKLGGYAEVVSDMEMELALKIGVSPNKIIWNGPYKNKEKLCELLLMGGNINLDSKYEINIIKDIAKRYSNKILNIGLRCNFEINDGVKSRFGFDVESEEFIEVLNIIKETKNLKLTGLQCHFACRDLKTWKPRAIGMLKILDKFNIEPEYIDLGGGLFGKMDYSLKKQFNCKIPNYREYADEIIHIFTDRYLNAKKVPLLLIEPGSALVGDCMKFVSRVINIKNIRGKFIATLLGSIYNINPTLNRKNPPIKIYKSRNKSKYYKDLDFGGYTCIESDYLYKHYDGELAVNDIVVFGNIGSYSVVLKPPFILPNFAILSISDGKVEEIKKKECFDDLFHTFSF